MCVWCGEVRRATQQQLAWERLRVLRGSVSKMAPYSLYSILLLTGPLGIGSKVVHYIGHRVAFGINLGSLYGKRNELTR